MEKVKETLKYNEYKELLNKLNSMYQKEQALMWYTIKISSMTFCICTNPKNMIFSEIRWKTIFCIQQILKNQGGLSKSFSIREIRILFDAYIEQNMNRNLKDLEKEIQNMGGKLAPKIHH